MTNSKDQTTYRFSWAELRRDWPLWLLIVATFAVTAYLYPRLPAELPSHWNIRGEVDGTTPKPWGAFMQPLMVAGLYVLFLIMPFIDPRRQNYSHFTGTYRLFRLLLVLFFCALQAVILLTGLGYAVPINRFMLVGMGLLFTLMGNSMGKIRHNWFVGIRTPWTLADEQVWRATHRVGGKLWTAAGVIMLLAVALPGAWRFAIGFGALGLATLATVVYSYVVWRQRQ